MNKNHERPLGLLTFVQAMGLCAMAICTAGLIGLPLSIPNYMVMEHLGLMDTPLWLKLAQVVASLGAGGCLMWLLAEFVLICGRVKKETAFTPANVRALGRIALAFLISGALLLLVGDPLMDWLLTGMRGVESPVWMLLPAFVAWAAALMVRAIQVLMRRAVEMQSEQDLTV